MADDLEDFLKQAAMRRQQRQQQKPNRPPIVQSPPPSREPSRLQQQTPMPTAEVVGFEKPYQPTVGNLSSSLPSVSLSEGVDQADERMQSHIKEVFQQQLGSLNQSNAKPSKGKKQSNPQRLKETPATPAEVQPVAKVSSASLVAQLRDPQSLRMAIIAHEIMKRPWQ